MGGAVVRHAQQNTRVRRIYRTRIIIYNFMQTSGTFSLVIILLDSTTNAAIHSAAPDKGW